MFADGGHLWIGHDQALWAAVAAFVQALPQDA